MITTLAGSGDAGPFDTVVDWPQDLALLGVLQQELTGLGVHAEIREHLMSLVVFRGSQRLPMCVFVSGGRFYCWDSGLRREHVEHVGHVAAELAELAAVPCHPREGACFP